MSGDAIAVVRDGYLVGGTPALGALLGLAAPDALVGTALAHWLGPEPPDEGMCLLRRADGVRRAVEVHTSPLAGMPGTTLVALRPPAVEPPADLYRAIFERNTAVKLLIEPATGQIVDVNAAAVAFYGWTREELLRKRVSEINTLTPDEVAVELEDARTGKRTAFHFRHRLASGQIRHVDIHSGQVEVGGRSLLLSIVQDVTDRVVLAQIQRNELIGRLAGGVAHDFNNLLTVVLGCGDLLEATLPPGFQGRRHLDDMLHAVRRAGELTRRLLDVGGRQVLVPEVVELGQVVDRVAGLLTSVVGAGRLRIAVPVGLVLAIDPGRLEQVLVNLVLNARDAGASRVDLVGERVDDEIVLRVRDDGRGMDEATLDHVFEPFFTTKTAGTAHGLGLASVHGIVVKSGGQIRVESALGRGATFSMSFPDAGRNAPRRRTPSPIPLSPAGQRVLLVDDEPDVRSVLVLALQVAGFVVSAAGSAEEVLALPEEDLRRLDCVVTDQGMPGLSGISLARALREIVPDLPVVVISGDLSARDRGELPTGLQFLQKPFSGPELATIVRRRIARRALGRPPASA